MDGPLLKADQTVGGDPAVLNDAIAVVVSEKAPPSSPSVRRPRTSRPTPKSTASSTATPPGGAAMFAAAGVADGPDGPDGPDDGYIPLGTRAPAYVQACRSLRHWDRAEIEAR